MLNKVTNETVQRSVNILPDILWQTIYSVN